MKDMICNWWCTFKYNFLHNKRNRKSRRVKISICDVSWRWAWLRKQLKKFLGKNGRDSFPTRNPSKLPPAGVPYEPVRLEIRLARPGNTTDRLPRMITRAKPEPQSPVSDSPGLVKSRLHCACRGPKCFAPWGSLQAVGCITPDLPS